MEMRDPGDLGIIQADDAQVQEDRHVLLNLAQAGSDAGMLGLRARRLRRRGGRCLSSDMRR